MAQWLALLPGSGFKSELRRYDYSGSSGRLIGDSKLPVGV